MKRPRKGDVGGCDIYADYYSEPKPRWLIKIRDRCLPQDFGYFTAKESRGAAKKLTEFADWIEFLEENK